MANEVRLIDANAAVKVLRGKCVAKYPNTFLMGLLASASEIEQIPTVDAVEVVHGRWKVGYLIHKYGCSCCGARQDVISPYCPNCGAKMDGGNDNAPK